MKKLILIIIVLFTVVACNGQTRITRGRMAIKYKPALPAKPDTAFLIVLTGQSNANSGGLSLGTYGYITSAQTKTKQYDTATKTFLNYQGVAGYNFQGLNFQTAGLQSVTHSDTIYTVKAAQGSLGIDNWYNTGGFMRATLDSQLKQSIRLLEARGKVVRVKSILWMQGEADAQNSGLIASYQMKLDSVIQRVYRLHTTAFLNTQFVALRLRTDYEDPTYITGGVAAINTAMTNLAAAYPARVVAPSPMNITGAVESNPGSIHYGYTGYIAIANYWHSIIPR